MRRGPRRYNSRVESERRGDGAFLTKCPISILVLYVAHALVRAVFALLRTQASGIERGVQTSACAPRVFIAFDRPAGLTVAGAFLTAPVENSHESRARESAAHSAPP